MTLSRLFYGLLACYFLVGMHIILPSPGGTGLYYSFNTIGWLVVSFIISTGLFQLWRSKQLLLSTFDIVVILGACCFIIPFLFQAPFQDHAIPRTIGLFAGVALLISLRQFSDKENHTKWILLCILAAVSIQAIVGLCQLILSHWVTIPYFDPDIHRAFGLFRQPNVMASFMATGLIVSCFLLANHNVEKTRRRHLYHIWLYLLIFATTLLIATSFSRTGQLGAAVGWLLLTPYLWKKSPKQLLKITCAIAIALSVGSQILHLNKSIANPKPYANTQVREDIYLITFSMIKENPITGVGYGGFQRQYLEQASQLRNVPESQQIASLPDLDHPHNEVLYWIAEGGIAPTIGFIVFVCAFGLLLIPLTWPMKLAACAFIFPILLHTQTEIPFYSSLSHWVTFICLISISAHWSGTRTYNFSMKKVGAATLCLAIITPIFSTLFLLTTLHTGHIVTQYEQSKNIPITSFNKIINPLPWLSRIEANIYANILVTSLKQQDEAKLRRYVEWAEKRVAYAPRKSLFNNMVFALGILQDDEKRGKVLSEGKRLFPDIEYSNIELSESKK